MSETHDHSNPYSELLSTVRVISVYNDMTKQDTVAHNGVPAPAVREEAPRRAVAVIIDDHKEVGRLISLLLESRFDEVIACTDPVEVTSILETKGVTHLLCDFNLGAGEGEVGGDGFVFASFWRREFQGIERVVVFGDGDLSTLEIPDEVDEVISKSLGPDAIIESLLGNLIS